MEIDILINPNIDNIIKAYKVSKWSQLRGYYDGSIFYFWDGFYTDHFKMINKLKVEYFEGYCFYFVKNLHKKYVIEFRKTVPSCVLENKFIKNYFYYNELTNQLLMKYK